jgi:hypothetical protein
MEALGQACYTYPLRAVFPHQQAPNGVFFDGLFLMVLGVAQADG